MNAKQKRGIWSWFVRSVLIMLVLGLAPLLAAGTVAWPAAWYLAGLLLFVVILDAVVLIPAQPALLVRRSGMGEGTKAWDRWLVPIVALLGPLLTMVVAGFDRRWGWTHTQSEIATVVGLGLVLSGSLLALWAMGVNPHFEGTVRIQTDRNHQVIRRGPYRLVRHPGYLGALVSNLGFPLALGAGAAWIPAALTIGALIWRTALEDETLKKELPGYLDYAGQVRRRLIPGFW